MSQSYKIIALKPGFEEWSNEYGTFHSYSMQVMGNGEPVSMNRKADSPAPKIGDEIYGDINVNSAGFQTFKSQKKPPTTTAPNAGYAGGTSRENLDVQDSIHRSVALNDAAVVWQGCGIAADYDRITELADVFYAWLIKQPVTGAATPEEKAGAEPWPNEMPEGWLVEGDNEAH